MSSIENSTIIYNLKIFTVVFILFISIDLPVTKFGFKGQEEQFKLINSGSSPSAVALWLNTFIKYIILSIGLCYFSISGKSYLASILYGLCVYGFYNTVNLATITNYDTVEAIINISYGTGLCLGIMVVTTLISKLLISVNEDSDVDLSETSE